MQQRLTIEQKYAIVLKNKDKFTAQQIKTINNLGKILQKGSYNQNPYQPLQFSLMVSLQTFYKCCAPAIYSISLEECNSKVIFAVGAIVAFMHPVQKHNYLQVQICRWAQSGGIKLFPLKQDAQKQKIQQYFKNVHAIIVSEFRGDPPQAFFDDFAQIMQQNPEIPILALGNSCIQLINRRFKLDICHKDTIQMKAKAQMYAFLSHQTQIFKDLDLKTRLQIQQKAKVICSSVALPLQVWQEKGNKDSKIHGLSCAQNDQWLICALSFENFYCAFLDVRQDANNMQMVEVNHSVILNFMEVVRGKQKKVQQKYSEVGHYKIVMKENKFIYNVDSKLPKH